MDKDRYKLKRKVGKGVAKSSVANNCLKEWKPYTVIVNMELDAQ